MTQESFYQCNSCDAARYCLSSDEHGCLKFDFNAMIAADGNDGFYQLPCEADLFCNDDLDWPLEQ